MLRRRYITANNAKENNMMGGLENTFSRTSLNGELNIYPSKGIVWDLVKEKAAEESARWAD
jgi:hypothetical protein